MQSIWYGAFAIQSFPCDIKPHAELLDGEDTDIIALQLFLLQRIRIPRPLVWLVALADHRSATNHIVDA